MGNNMDFLYEKQNRQYMGFLASFCMVLFLLAFLLAVVQTQGMKHILLEREKTVVSSLLRQGVSPETVAAAYQNETVTAEGIAFLEKIGWSQGSGPLIFPEVRQQTKTAVIILTGAALGLSALLLAGAILFLKERERMYREAAEVIGEFATGNFAVHLCRDQEGMLYRMFAAVDQLAKALQAKGEMALRAKESLKNAVSDISHQLKTPLAALHMYAEIMLEEPDNPIVVDKFAQKSLASLSRIELLVQTLLKVMRLDAGSVVFDKKEIKASKLALAAMEAFGTRVAKEGKRLLAEGDPDTAVDCDLLWTTEALSNLVKNALDHTESGGTIRIGWQESPGLVRLWVSDDGCGIAPEDMPFLFRRFFTKQSAADRQGVGLGLALAKTVVEQQGGILSADSRPGEGAVFTITFTAS